jgi:hypothetical protein
MTEHVVYPFADLARAVPRVERTSTGDRCVLRLCWVRTGAIWELRAAETLFATAAFGPGFDGQAISAAGAWLFSFRTPFFFILFGQDRIRDRRTSNEIGRFNAGFGNSGTLKLVDGQAFDWSRLKLSAEKGWQFGRPEENLNVRLLNPMREPRRDKLVSRLAPGRPTQIEVELRWRSPLPEEAALLCCLGLRLRLQPMSARGGGG